jgi:hypothetical protein
VVLIAIVIAQVYLTAPNKDISSANIPNILHPSFLPPFNNFLIDKILSTFTNSTKSANLNEDINQLALRIQLAINNTKK